MAEPVTLTHHDLVCRAVRWLRSRRHPVVAWKPTVLTLEIPDAIGWDRQGWSTLVECKVSRADFARDAAKTWRKFPEMGMGTWRYYMVPAGLLTPDDMPPGWGLLAVAGRRVVERRKPTQFMMQNRRSEAALLVRQALDPDGLPVAEVTHA